MSFFDDFDFDSPDGAILVEPIEFSWSRTKKSTDEVTGVTIDLIAQTDENIRAELIRPDLFTPVVARIESEVEFTENSVNGVEGDHLFVMKNLMRLNKKHAKSYLLEFQEELLCAIMDLEPREILVITRTWRSLFPSADVSTKFSYAIHEDCPMRYKFEEIDGVEGVNAEMYKLLAYDMIGPAQFVQSRVTDHSMTMDSESRELVDKLVGEGKTVVFQTHVDNVPETATSCIKNFPHDEEILVLCQEGGEMIDLEYIREESAICNIERLRDIVTKDVKQKPLHFLVDGLTPMYRRQRKIRRKAKCRTNNRFEQLRGGKVKNKEKELVARCKDKTVPDRPPVLIPVTYEPPCIMMNVMVDSNDIDWFFSSLYHSLLDRGGQMGFNEDFGHYAA